MFEGEHYNYLSRYSAFVGNNIAADCGDPVAETQHGVRESEILSRRPDHVGTHAGNERDGKVCAHYALITKGTPRCYARTPALRRAATPDGAEARGVP